MTSLEENLVGRELLDALDKSPEVSVATDQGYLKSGMSFDYRPRFVYFYKFEVANYLFSDLRQLIWLPETQNFESTRMTQESVRSK